MSFILKPWQLFFVVLSAWVHREQQKIIEFYQVELESMMKIQGNKRLLLTDAQRRLLAVKGKSLGRKTLMELTTIVQADTILRWHRELIEPKGDSKTSHNLGRPPKDQEVVDLVLRMARENVTWGYKRIEGALHNLGYQICSSTVANILKQHGIEPAPQRKRQLSWSTFLKAHMNAFQGADFLAVFSHPKRIFPSLPTLVGIIRRVLTDSETPSTKGLCRCVDDAVIYRFPQTENKDVYDKQFGMDRKYSRQLIRPPPIFCDDRQSSHPGTHNRAA